MKYSGAGFELVLSGNTLAFSGNLEEPDYADIDKFLRDVDQAIHAEVCIIELTQLNFINSSGIKSLVTFMLGSPKKFEIRVNSAVSWQKVSIPVLAMLKPHGITIVS